jgi:hypothetical protein
MNEGTSEVSSLMVDDKSREQDCGQEELLAEGVREGLGIP